MRSLICTVVVRIWHKAVFLKTKLNLSLLLTDCKSYNVSHLMTKPTKWHVCPAKTQISLGIRPVWSASSLAWRKLGSLATNWAHSEDSDQTGGMPRLIWVFAGRTATLLVLSCRGSCSYLACRFYRPCTPILRNAFNLDLSYLPLHWQVLLYH